MSLPPEGTLLVITPLSGASALTLAPYSGRGLSQSLRQIGGPKPRRTVSGRLIDMTYAPFKQYASTITCKDMSTPCLDDAWRGLIVVIDCVAELSYVTGVGSPHRPVVSGSSYTDGPITRYRPQLTMMVMDIDDNCAEWDAEIQWRIDLEELEPVVMSP